jgi:quercetin dioxygenase-like cupin family protein
MAMQHLSSGGIMSILPLGNLIKSTPTAAIFKNEHLEVIRIVLTAGMRMPTHAVAGSITVQCIEGEVDIGVDGVNRKICAGDLLYLAGGVEHDLTAIVNSSLLVTIALLPRKGCNPVVPSIKARCT